MTSGTIRHLNDGFIPSFGADFDEKLPTITEILTEKSYNIGDFELNIIYHNENIEIELPQINSVYTHMLGHNCHSIVAGEGHANAIIEQLKGYIKKNYTIAKAFSKIGKENNITLHACCEKEYLKDYGLDITGCMSQEIVEKVIQNKLNAPKNNSKRMQCNCLMGNDVGAYNSCMHLCKYCYANANQGLVKENVKKHNPDSPF